MRRVVVTGMGSMTPLGLTTPALWSALIEGRSGIQPMEGFDMTQYSSRIAGQIRDFVPESLIDPKECKRMDRYAQLAMAASHEAMLDSGLELEKEDATRIGVYIGSGIGGIGTLESQKEVLIEKGPRRVSPFLIPMMIGNIASGLVSIRYGIKGPNSSCVTACATGAHSIGDAFRIIQRGDADVMVAGGSEAPLTPIAFAGFGNMKALSTRNDEPQRASRPFDRDRDGFVMAEGAGVVILEALDHALARGARIHGEIVGYGMTGDAHHITAPAPGGEGAMRAMAIAIKDAGLELTRVDYINAHGTSTPPNDLHESQAIRTLFGPHADRLVVSSTKSMTGHLLGAAGGVEFIATVLALKEGVIPPTINLDHPGEGCDLDYCPHTARKKEIQVAISNSLGFGGHNAVLVARKYSA